MNETLKTKFENLVCALSPENLYCDGEVSPTQARARERVIRKEWAALEKEAGRKVTENEVWGWITPRFP